MLDSRAARQNQMMQYWSSPHVASGFARDIFDLLLACKGAALQAWLQYVLRQPLIRIQ